MATSKQKPTPYQMNVVASFTNPVSESEEAARWIKVGLIDCPAQQPRRYFDAVKMAQLIASVQKDGVLEPLLVRPQGEGRYELVAGERRLRAAKANHLEQVPCVVKSLSDTAAMEIALLENLQRDDLNPVEETEGILALLGARLKQPRENIIAYFWQTAHPNRTQDQRMLKSDEWKMITTVFETIGRFTVDSFRTNRLPLLNLPAEVLEAIAQGQIAYSKGQLIGRVQNPTQRQALLNQAIQENLSQRQIRQRVKVLNQKPKSEGGIEELLGRFNTVRKRIRQSNLWQQEHKQQQVQNLLVQLEQLLDD